MKGMRTGLWYRTCRGLLQPFWTQCLERVGFIVRHCKAGDVLLSQSKV